jgi:heptaprenyl diphosphate synthase
MVLSYFERFIPLPWNAPGMKLGLANIITLSSFYFFRKRDVFLVVLLRVVLTSLIIGSMLSFFYSLAGGILSFIGMGLLHQFFKKTISPIGISIVGAILHNIGQLIVLTVISERLTIALSYAPLIMVAGIATGVFVGIASTSFMKAVPLTQLK